MKHTIQVILVDGGVKEYNGITNVLEDGNTISLKKKSVTKAIFLSQEIKKYKYL